MIVCARVVSLGCAFKKISGANFLAISLNVSYLLFSIFQRTFQLCKEKCLQAVLNSCSGCALLSIFCFNIELGI